MTFDCTFEAREKLWKEQEEMMSKQIDEQGKQIDDLSLQINEKGKQIDDLSKKLPNTKDKLNKLYEHYLPILVKILQQYESLQVATSDPAYGETKEKLSNTIQLINTAMKNIISSMTDQDFINLSADISTLEAVLKKDGLTDQDQMLAKSIEK